MNEDQRMKLLLDAIKAVETALRENPRVHRRKTDRMPQAILPEYDISDMQKTGGTVCGGCGGDLQYMAWVSVKDDCIVSPAGGGNGTAHVRCPECGARDVTCVSRGQFDGDDTGTKWTVRQR